VARVVFFACVALWPLAGRADDNPFQAWANMIAYTPARYRGPLTAFPEARARPSDRGAVLRSERWPLSVHAPRSVPPPKVERALRAAEAAYDWLYDQGWPLPYPDGGYGGSLDFDLYLAPRLERAASAAADVPIAWTTLDASSSYALLDSQLASASLERCALAAVTEASLLGQDPAEPVGARRGVAAFVTWLATGQFGCDGSIDDAQHAPQLGLVGSSDEQITSLAWLLARLSQRHDGSSGSFSRELWQLCRQRSEHPDALHAEPSFWQALEAALDKAGESLDQVAVELAVARYFSREPGAQHALPVVSGPALAALPKHLPPSDAALRTYGSAYTLVDTTGAADGKRLQVWLRGERGVRWSLLAVRLDAHGNELGRVEAPARKVSDSFLPVELTSDTARVLVVVTKLPRRHPGERAEDDDEDSFALILSATQS
jgi:hypothetical protein